MKIIGKPTINPVLFYSGKIAGYITWILLLLSIVHLIRIQAYSVALSEYFAYLLLAIGLVLSIISMKDLGNSTTLGLPITATALKKGGLYKISRNPMYLGFNLVTIASMIFQLHIIIAIMGIYSIAVYHLIILAEEKYLEKQFGKDYIEYKQQVRRYL